MTLRRLCVFAGSSPGSDPAFAAAARAVGSELAAREIGLVYGGASVGLMGQVADSALAAGGEVIGVLPEALERREIGHRGLTELRIVGSMHERKAEMARLSDAFLALPGGLGTFEELLEMSTWTQLGIHHKPVGLLDVAQYWEDLEHMLDHAVRERFVGAEHRALLTVERSVPVMLDRLDKWEPTSVDKWVDPPESADGTGATLSEFTATLATVAAPATPAVAHRDPLVGASAVVVRDGAVLLGLRRASHGAGSWAFPGGKLELGESPEQAVARELEEETGLRASRITPISWTSDVFTEERLHFITLHHAVVASGEPAVREPGKTDGWSWHDWGSLPGPLFAPAASLVATGWRPGSA